MRVLLLFVVALLGACATPSTGVVPLSDGLAKVTHQGSGAWVTTSDLKARAVQEASAWCDGRKQRVRVIDVKETPARPLGGWPEAEVLFKCE